MVIASSQIGMESARKYTSVSRDAYMSLSAELKEGTDIDLKDQFKNSMSDLLKESENAVKTDSKTAFDKLEQDAISRIRTECISYLIRILFGGKLDENEDLTLSEITSKSENRNPNYYFQKQTIEHYYKESEETSFETTGKVVTADGRELEFNLSLSMSRSFEESYRSEVENIVSVMCDPLVINLDSDIAQVSDQKISFDLDQDGKEDRISRLAKGSGFLAIDKNEDGMVNDGSELFGTKTGDGFYDLSKYDEDKNGFIDEADSVFEKLRICVFDDKGEQTLYKLKEKDIGAIYLGNAATDFKLNDHHTNRTNAAIRKTGIFLYENGSVGSIQHVDLAKELLA
ncbi:MAG: hypothetical protein K5931_02095 [Lachnospiraceae bacterium]|nr:hypothetical protein [Lachnospiraceae bacterium]